MLYNGIIKGADKRVDQSYKNGPFDIIGDVHGCYYELLELVGKLGYVFENGSETAVPEIHDTNNRTLVFLGDLIDRGPDSLAALQFVIRLCEKGQALCIPGNHDEKLMRYLMGHHIVQHGGIETTIKELKGKDGHLLNYIKNFLSGLPSYLLLDEKKLLIAHAGLREKHHGKTGRDIREYCLFGEGPVNADGEKKDIFFWIDEYRGESMVIYGHAPVRDVDVRNNTVNIDTGCVYGGKLTAYRYPENKIVAVEARKQYFKRSVDNPG